MTFIAVSWRHTMEGACRRAAERERARLAQASSLGTETRASGRA